MKNLFLDKIKNQWVYTFTFKGLYFVRRYEDEIPVSDLKKMIKSFKGICRARATEIRNQHTIKKEDCIDTSDKVKERIINILYHKKLTVEQVLNLLFDDLNYSIYDAEDPIDIMLERLIEVDK